MSVDRPSRFAALSSPRFGRVLDVIGYLAMAILVAYTASRWGPRYFDPYLQSDDTRIVIYPFWSYHSDLFKGDYLADAMRTLAPPFYRLLVYILTAFLDVLLIPKVIQLVAIGWCAVHASRMGHRRAGGMGALLGVYLVLHSFPILDRTGGGLPRAFAFPLMLMLADSIERAQEKRAGAATLLGFALYPPTGLLASLIYGPWMIFRSLQAWQAAGRDRRVLLRSLGLLGLVAVLSGAVLAPAMRPGKGYGRIHNLKEAETMPAFGPGGRTELIPLSPVGLALEEEYEDVAEPSWDALTGWIWELPYTGEYVPMDAILVMAIALTFLGRPVLLILPAMIFTVGIVGFLLANALAFRLYDPGRMLTLSLPIAVIVLVLRGYTVWGRGGDYPVVGRGLAAGAFLMFIVFQGGAYEGYPHLNVDAREEKPLFELVQTLPRDALIAGHPRRLDNLTLWGKRPVFITEETSQPWFTGIWAETERRLTAVIEAYYATGPEPVERLHETWGVTHMLVHEDDLSLYAVNHADMFAPYGELMKEMAGVAWGRMLWSKLPKSVRVGEASGFILIDLEAALDHLRAGEIVQEPDGTPGQAAPVRE